jgi:hypothetical protein
MAPVPDEWWRGVARPDPDKACVVRSLGHVWSSMCRVMHRSKVAFSLRCADSITRSEIMASTDL